MRTTKFGCAKKLKHNKHMQNTLIKYIRNKKGEPRGVVVAVRNLDHVGYGYALCSPKDKWCKIKGLRIALTRASTLKDYPLPTVSTTEEIITKEFEALSKRAVKYFKNIPLERAAFDSNTMVVNW